MYKVELFLDNCWCHLSWHKNIENAEVAADVHSKSRFCEARVTNAEGIVYFVDKPAKK